MKCAISVVLFLVALSVTVDPARGVTIVIDDASAGSVYDGILDGFPFPPPGAPQDGTPDFTGNALAIALQTGVTEERGIAEFSLASLAGLGSGDLDSATLTFNIDDVLATFGPGTTFDGTAAETMVLFSYSGNGTIELGDFANVVGAPLEVIDTTPLGVINDTTLGTSGPLQFEVDITAALGALLDGSATYIGIVFTTNDNLSATSIDNLGPGGSGPAGVGGAIMPFLTIVTVEAEPPVLSEDARKCQKSIGKGGAKFTSAVYKSLGKCLDAALVDAAGEAGFAKSTEKCTASLTPTDPNSKVGKAIAKFRSAVVDKCTGVTPADLGNPCDGVAATLNDLATCLVNDHKAQVETSVRSSYAAACPLITAVGLDDAFPGLCAAP